MRQTACLVGNPITVGTFALISPSIARRRVGRQTLWRFRLKDVSIDERFWTWCRVFDLVHQNLIVRLCLLRYCWVLIFVSSPFYSVYILGNNAWISLGSFMRTNHLCVLIKGLRMRLVPLNMFKPTSKFCLTDRSFVDAFCYLCVRVCLCYTGLSVHCSLVIGWPLGSLVCDVSCVFVTFPYGGLVQVWYLIVSSSDLCLHSYLTFSINFYRVFYYCRVEEMNVLFVCFDLWFTSQSKTMVMFT